MSDAALLAAFHAGSDCSRFGGEIDDNPHPQGSALHDAWATGFEEEAGPVYVVVREKAEARFGRRTATLADVWPQMRSG